MPPLQDYLLTPQAWPLLLLAPLSWLLSTFRDGARRRANAALLGPRAERLTDRSEGARRLRRWCGSTACLLAAIAVLQPLGGSEPRAVQQRGIDIAVCLDVSRSMLARDLPPDRLAAAQREIAALAQRLRGDRVALVLFAGTARLQVPLTKDQATLVELAQQAGPSSIARGGTDLAAALDTALQALADTQEGCGAILLLTDGEDLQQRGLQAALRCRQRGVTVHCVGFGSLLGSKIALGDDGFVRDQDGNEVVSALHPDSLRALASATGGDYVDASLQPRPLVMLYEQRLLPMRRQAFASQERAERQNLYQWPLLAAVLLWMLEFSWCERRRR